MNFLTELYEFVKSNSEQGETQSDNKHMEERRDSPAIARIETGMDKSEVNFVYTLIERFPDLDEHTPQEFKDLLDPISDSMKDDREDAQALSLFWKNSLESRSYIFITPQSNLVLNRILNSAEQYNELDYYEFNLSDEEVLKLQHLREVFSTPIKEDNTIFVPEKRLSDKAIIN